MINEVLHFITNASFESTNRFLTSVLPTNTLPKPAMNDKYIVNTDLDSKLKELKDDILHCNLVHISNSPYVQLYLSILNCYSQPGDWESQISENAKNTSYDISLFKLPTTDISTKDIVDNIMNNNSILDYIYKKGYLNKFIVADTNEEKIAVILTMIAKIITKRI